MVGIHTVSPRHALSIPSLIKYPWRMTKFVILGSPLELLSVLIDEGSSDMGSEIGAAST